ncbi:hypothetical protein [Gracilibacillus alcaliphilus]|uniref:hypothetical protein n=1 Tax=Gracilibacillus alcaliphilus TaxID=1401441 RepID=UPI0019580996|nr:hypothetical protein [Gracilibacillus alcaliphilus]MBM7676367.1 hypothetical protein [Gracilibacillus alcaliphilus]
MKKWLAMLSISTLMLGGLSGCMGAGQQQHNNQTPPPLEKAPDSSEDSNQEEG